MPQDERTLRLNGKVVSIAKATDADSKPAITPTPPPDSQRCERKYQSGKAKGQRCTERGSLRNVQGGIGQTYMRLCDGHAEKLVASGYKVITMPIDDPREVHK